MPQRLSGDRFAVGPGLDDKVRAEELALDPALAVVENRARRFAVGGGQRSWPDGFERRGRYPDDVELDWTGTLGGPQPQGVSHDVTHWYFTTNDRIFKVPFGHDLSEDFGLRPFGPFFPIEEFVREGEAFRTQHDVLYRYIPAELQDDFDHFGDPVAWEGVLYVPMEFGVPSRVAAFRTDTLEFLGSAALRDVLARTQNRASFCALNPRNGLLYCGTRDEESGRSQILALTPRLERGRLTDLDPIGELRGSEIDGRVVDGDSLRVLQGGAFSPRGHLYLSWDADREEDRGVLALDVDVLAAVIVTSISIHRRDDPVPAFFGGRRELEGITVIDLDDERDAREIAPGVRGQIHIMEVNFAAPSLGANLIFHHFGSVPHRLQSLV